MYKPLIVLCLKSPPLPSELFYLSFSWGAYSPTLPSLTQIWICLIGFPKINDSFRNGKAPHFMSDSNLNCFISPSLEQHIVLHFKSDSNLNLFDWIPPKSIIPLGMAGPPHCMSDSNLNCFISPSLEEHIALHFKSDSNLNLFECIPQDQSISQLKSYSGLNLIHKSWKFVWVSTHPLNTTIIEQLGDPTRGKLPLVPPPPPSPLFTPAALLHWLPCIDRADGRSGQGQPCSWAACC